MKNRLSTNLLAAALVGAMAFTFNIARAQDPLPSWNDGPAKKSIVDFVAKVTRPDSPDFVPVPERIATFDNDGTLWCEQPLPVQAFFVFDRVKDLAPQHPEWKTKESVRGAVAHAMTCKKWPIYASRDAEQPARRCTDPRDFYSKL